MSSDRGVLVVIVNYRTADLVIDCLASLEIERASLPGMHVVVTDNASGDNSVERLNETVKDRGWGQWTTIMPLAANGGFAFGNNAAIRPALSSGEPPDMVLLLNPDTVVRPGGITHLVDYLTDHPEAAMAGSRLEAPDGTPQRSAFRVITPGSELLTTARLGVVRKLQPSWEIAMPVENEPHRADWLAGAALLIRREVFDAIGLMDEAYFLYFEEVDFCFRAQQAGHDCWYVPGSHVMHLEGAATGVSSGARKARRRPAYWFESRRNYFLKNWGRSGALIADFNWAVGHVIWRIRTVLTRQPNNDPPFFFRDFLSHSVWFRGFER